MDTLLFKEFSYKCRIDFLNKLSNCKELNIEMLQTSSETFYLKRIYQEYLSYLHNLHESYSKDNNIEILFDDIIYDFISSMEDQINDTSFITKNERCMHLVSIEYNMIVNIHKFAYELFSRNHTLNEMDFFHGTSLTSLLENNEITIEKFRQESFYDIDNFNHIKLPDDYEYLTLTKMIDIYLLNIISDIYNFEDYKDFFSIMYTFNSKGLLDKDLYRYFLTLEDVLYAKKSIAKNLSYAIMIIAIITSLAIFLMYEIM